MKTIPKSWNLLIINQRKAKINPKPQYQRTPVWSLSKKQLLIDSILRGYDIPKFYLGKSSEPEYEHEVVDGQQRLHAIWEFLSDQYALGEASKELPQGDLTGKLFSQLPSDVQDELGLFELNVHIIDDASELEIRDLFLRLQEGVSLNPAERRNAMAGNMRDFIADLAETHKVFALTHINPKRYAWHDLAALITRLELAGGPTDIKAPSLRQMYDDEQVFDKDGAVAKKIKRNLNYLARVLKDGPPEMDIKWGFVDLYLAVSKLLDGYVLTGRQDEVADSFISFEEDRRQAIQGEPADLLMKGDPWSEDLFNYIQAFTTSGGTQENVATRHEVYIRRLLRDLSDLKPKDPKRDFTKEERRVIWRRDNRSCQVCGKEVSFDEMQADHKKAHSKGGATTIENGQTLCAACNLKKGAKSTKA